MSAPRRWGRYINALGFDIYEMYKLRRRRMNKRRSL